MKLVQLLEYSKKHGMLYSTIPYNCGLDEAINYVNNVLKSDKGFNENQLTIKESPDKIVFEIRKTPKHKKCFTLTTWRV